jgi:nondiscriminating aspartyl-tRNA synthetase
MVHDGSTHLHVESVVEARGTVRENDKAPGGLELHLDDIRVLAAVDAELPIPVNQDPAGLGIDALLDNRILSLRNPSVRAIFEIQATIVGAFADVLRGRDFTEIKSSKLIGTGTEGGTGLFAVDYFGDRVYLAQSPQFYKQAMVASGLERVFEIGAAYRAEKHDTPRHLNEYVSLDVEMGFISGYEDLMDLEIDILAHVFGTVSAEHQETLTGFDAVCPGPDQIRSTPRIDHEQAKSIASERVGKKLFEINPEAERALCDWAVETSGVPAVFAEDPEFRPPLPRPGNHHRRTADPRLRDAARNAAEVRPAAG